MNDQSNNMSTCEQVLVKVGVTLVEFCKKNLKFNQHLKIKGQITVNIDEQEYRTYISSNSGDDHSSETCPVSVKRPGKKATVSKKSKKKKLKGKPEGPKSTPSYFVAIHRDAEDSTLKPAIQKSGTAELSAAMPTVTTTTCRIEPLTETLHNLHSEGNLNSTNIVSHKSNAVSESSCADVGETVQHQTKNGEAKTTALAGQNEDCTDEEEYSHDFETIATDTEVVQYTTYCAKKEKKKKKFMVECLACGKRLASRVAQSRHIREIHKDKCTCSQCGKVFSSYKSFIAHYTRTHTLSETEHICEQCGKVFKTKGTYREHMKYHRFTKDPHICDLCGKSYVTKEGLQTHKLSHTGEKPFPCHLCGKRFQSRGLLGSHHAYSHNDSRPWMCDICGATHKTKNRMKMHKKYQHLTTPMERKHECEECGKRFLFKHGLDRHVKTHTDVRDFVCVLCGKSFKRSSHLKAHMEGVHKLKGEIIQIEPKGEEMAKTQKPTQSKMPDIQTVAQEVAVSTMARTYTQDDMMASEVILNQLAYGV